MQTLVNLTRSTAISNNHRYRVLGVITNELYPAEKFPPRSFPDIGSTLLDLFIEVIKSQNDLWELYISDKEHDRIKKAAREILNFRNLLENHPQTVVLIYQKYIKKFIAYKHPNPDEREDISQEVITRLIADKIYKIQKKYDFNFKTFDSLENLEHLKEISSFTSYLMVTVRNIYIDIMRERNIRPLTTKGVEGIDDVPDKHGDKKMINSLMLKEELIKLQTILILYHKSRAKLELCLKLKYRIPVTRKDVEKCFPACNDEDIKTLTQDFMFYRDKRIFEKILSVFNFHEARKNKSDTLRKWINVKVDEIIRHLNRTHQCKVYNSKNIADFIALYYQNIEGDKTHV
jgi:DNA-directed RNA polymerase specialized sigma24 family protein